MGRADTFKIYFLTEEKTELQLFAQSLRVGSVILDPRPGCLTPRPNLSGLTLYLNIKMTLESVLVTLYYSASYWSTLTVSA